MQSDDLGLVERIRAACVGHPHAKIAWPHRILHEAADALAAKDAAIERLVAERDEARRVKRWNAEEMGGTLHVCRGDHDGDNCEWESFVPADHLRAAEAQRDKLIEALKFYADSEGWKGRFEQDGPSSIMHHSGPVLIDRGARARQALGETP